MIFRPTDFGNSIDKNRLAVTEVCLNWNIKCNLKLSSMWAIHIHDEEKDFFTELVKEKLKELA